MRAKPLSEKKKNENSSKPNAIVNRQTDHLEHILQTIPVFYKTKTMVIIESFDFCHLHSLLKPNKCRTQFTKARRWLDICRVAQCSSAWFERVVFLLAIFSKSTWTMLGYFFFQCPKNDSKGGDYELFNPFSVHVCLRCPLSGAPFETIVFAPRFLSIYKQVIRSEVISSLPRFFRKPCLSFLPFPYLPIEPLCRYSVIVFLWM